MTSSAPLHPAEKQRLRALERYKVLDTDPEPAFDDLAKVAAHICDTPMALVSLVDESRQWFKAKVGLDATETPRDIAFCAHAILDPGSVLQVSDPTKDERFKNNPLVTGEPNIGFYAGAPLVAETGEPLGTLCVLDTVPKALNKEQLDALQALSRQVVNQLEIRKTNHELQRRNEELAQFAYRVSHDFKAPLSSSKNLSELLLADLADNDLQEVETNAARIKQQMIKLESFVDEMLNLARADLAEDDSEKINIESLLKEVTDRHENLILENRVRVITDVDPDLTLYTSKIRLFQVLDNLISNGVKYKKPDRQDPFVSISCSEKPDSMELLIRDNGVGIPAKEHDQVGNLFKRFHPGLADGSGLGLAIVYKHLDALNATVEFNSSEEGTRFTIQLPRARAGL